ncbi:hypothetical protein EGW08_002923 [Elysia chlorotica]|uniref:Dynein heavy chain C-terminal domain-containing protein n=1 Tax=Elysia chlorotica TaxID=188477 RepID=A0A433U651_ELYCH|nr:hypothetical protein EGW08_002923 [Elysia chlorotica]
MLLTKDETEPPLEDLLLTISELVYGAMVAEDTDRKYIQALCDLVIGSVYREPQSEILLGGTLIPVPPATIDPMEYAEWFEQTADDKMTLKTLQLNTTVERCTNEASSTNFVARLDRMFETQNMEAGDVAIPPPSATASLLASPGGNSGTGTTGGFGVPSFLPSISIDKLRSALDICLEHLPLLLDLGDEAAQLLMRTDYDFPYHCPSIISMSSAESSLMPESIGYVLLQECLWMNTALCHIRQEIADLQGRLVGGAGALPVRLLPTALSVQEEYVPTSWIHPNCQPCTHSLVTWLGDLNKRHIQLNRWVRRGMVPTFNLKNDGLEPSQPSTIARGQLTNVWLGGLVNPGALLTALRQEKAILARADLDDVEFHAMVMHDASQADFELDEGGIFVSDLVLENAEWDYKENGLAEAKGAGISSLRCVYLKPVVRVKRAATKIMAQEDMDEDEEQSGEKTFSTKNATIGEDAKSVTSNTKKDSSNTGNEGGETAATAVPGEDNKTQEEEVKAAEEGQATRPKSRNSQKSVRQDAAERKSVGGGSNAGGKEDNEEDLERAEEGEEGALPPGMVEVPVYMNKSRQIQVWSLPMRTSSPDVNWTLCRVALLLDEGLPEGGCKKSRAYLMLQRLQPMMRPSQPEDDEEEGQEEEDDVDDVDEEEEEEVNVEADSGAESTRSQLSYKPMSPKAPPLPEGLGLKREHPLAEGKEGDEKEARPLSRMSAQSRGREENGVKEEKKSEEEGGAVKEDQVDGIGNVNDAGEKEKGEGKGESQSPLRGDEPDAERHDRQREEDRGEEAAVAQDGQASSAPAGQQDEASKSGAGAVEEDVIPHPGSRQASRGSKRNVDGANPTAEDRSGEVGGGQRATEDSKTDTATDGAARVKSGTRKASGKGNGGRGGEEEAPAQKSGTPGAKKAEAPASKPASRESQKQKTLETKVADAESTAPVNDQPTETENAQKQEAENTENLSGGQEGSGGRGMEEDPSKTETGGDSSAVAGVEAGPVERSDDAGHMTLDLKPAETSAPATTEKPASEEKPPTREKPASKEKPASREKLASRGKVASREKPASRGSQLKTTKASKSGRGTEEPVPKGDTA